jgi:NTP pyrophosphatase (non-canonical NTP hydrolase)
MDIDEYQRLAARTAKSFNHLETDLVHAALGLATESGEFTTIVKRCAIYDIELTADMRNNLYEELGDVMWYVALAATKLGVNLSSVAGLNVEKLRQRFPRSYSDQAAEARADKGGADARNS